jgi:hypothetical protein
MGDKKEVFISYSRADARLAEFFCNLLEGAGISCWIAPRDIPPMTQWAEGIVQGLGDCRVMALLVSSSSLASVEVAKEVDIANSSKKDILPIRVEDILLTGGLKYHLCTRQWVDAINGERIARFHNAMTAIVGTLYPSEETDVGSSSILGKAKALAAELNKKYAELLDSTDAMISAREKDDKVSIFYPLKIGATGVKLIAEFDQSKKTIRIYADSDSDGDPLNEPFSRFIEGIYKHLVIHGFERTFRGRKNAFVILMPTTALTTSLLDESSEQCFARFANHVRRLSEIVLVDLMKWSAGSKAISFTINALENGLRSLFPPNEGWFVGAREGDRLDAFRKEGKLNVYKESWRPKDDDYRARGLLSITLEAGGHFLQSLKMGILKYEKWHDLGTYGQRILNDGRARVTDTVIFSDWYPLEFALPNDWGDCGLAEAKCAGSEKLDRFVEEVLDRFKKLKTLEPLLDEACAAIPALQDKDAENLATLTDDWATSALFVRNRLRLLAKIADEKRSSDRVNVRIKFMHPTGSDLLLSVKVGNFDAAVKFSFDFHKFTTSIVSLEPPDFEPAIVQAFIKKHHPNLLIDLESTNSGMSLPQWLDSVKTVVADSVTPYFDAMDHLARHLERCRELTEAVASLLRSGLPESEDWIVENHAARSLEPGNGIAICRKSWFAHPHKEGVTSPLFVQIVPNKPCFDELCLAITFVGQRDTELDRAIGRIDGACDFAFREQVTNAGESPIKGIWARPLKAPFQQTGGSTFETQLLGETERPILDDAVLTIAKTIKQLEPLLADLCRQHNQIESNAEYKAQREARKKEMLEAIPCAGVIGNHALRMNLGWNDNSLYDRIRDELISEGHLEKKRQRGGGVARVDHRPDVNGPIPLDIPPSSSVE